MGRVPLTSVGQGEDRVLWDAHTQGDLPELLQQALPELRLPPCKWEAEKILEPQGLGGQDLRGFCPEIFI